MRQCKTCIYYSAWSGNRNRGQCRRHAPTLDLGQGEPKTLWPMVSDQHFCGDHETEVSNG